VEAVGSGGAKVLRTKAAQELVSKQELASLRKNNRDAIQALEAFFTSHRGSKSINLNRADMNLLRALAPNDGYFTPTEKSSSADSWIRWLVQKTIYELFIQAKSHQPITVKLVIEEVKKVVFSTQQNVKACLLIVSLNEEVSLGKGEGFKSIVKDDKEIAYHMPSGATIKCIVRKSMLTAQQGLVLFVLPYNRCS